MLGGHGFLRARNPCKSEEKIEGGNVARAVPFHYRVTSLIRKRLTLGPYSRPRGGAFSYERGTLPEREFFIENLLVRIHFIIVMIRRTGLAPWEFEFPFQVALHLPS